MASSEQLMRMDIKIGFSLSLWQAFKLRLAGEGAKEICKTLAQMLVENKDLPEIEVIDFG